MWTVIEKAFAYSRVKSTHVLITAKKNKRHLFAESLERSDGKLPISPVQSSDEQTKTSPYLHGQHLDDSTDPVPPELFQNLSTQGVPTETSV